MANIVQIDLHFVGPDHFAIIDFGIVHRSLHIFLIAILKGSRASDARPDIEHGPLFAFQPVGKARLKFSKQWDGLLLIL